MAAIPMLKAEELLPEPVPPEDWECCGSECGEACIQTIYLQEKRAYEAQQRQWREQQAAGAAARQGGEHGH